MEYKEVIEEIDIRIQELYKEIISLKAEKKAQLKLIELARNEQIKKDYHENKHNYPDTITYCRANYKKYDIAAQTLKTIIYYK